MMYAKLALENVKKSTKDYSKQIKIAERILKDFEL